MDFMRPVEAIVPGAQGRVLAVLAETTAELNLRTIAELSGGSLVQASRVLPGLVALGVLERREVPPSSLFRFVQDHVASRAILALARATDTVLEELGRLATSLLLPPLSVVAFGSFARREADAESDIDLLVVRPDDVDEDDEKWAASTERLHGEGRRLTGNRLEVLEVSTSEVAALLNSRRPLWADIRRDGRVVHGLPRGSPRRSACRGHNAPGPCRRHRSALTQPRPRSSPKLQPAT
jgi:predicted nucleotidyltransferase